jgi:predicted dithiol-disulfide oxidoreductase (DUF899 family)
MNSTTIERPAVVSEAEWLAARQSLLAREKAFTRQCDALSAERRALPWVRVARDYVFEAPEGQTSLSELFGGRSQLIVYHFMFGPGWGEGCKSCSLAADNFNVLLVHLAARDVSFAAVSRAPLAELTPFKRRMGWSFPWVSSCANTFNRDYHVSFTKEQMESGKMYYNYRDDTMYPSEEAHGASVFYRDNAGGIFHTYSSYGRGIESWLGVYQFLDLVPKGRDEAGLPFTMAWIRHHDRYGADAEGAG